MPKTTEGMDFNGFPYEENSHYQIVGLSVSSAVKKIPGIGLLVKRKLDVRDDKLCQISLAQFGKSHSEAGS